MASLNQTITSLKTSFGAEQVICYATSDKKPENLFATSVALDTLPFFRKILASGGKKNKIVFAVMTNGGALEAPWPIVNLIRDYCDELHFVVLERALSAGTLLALGADKIIMTPGSYISPIDPRKTKNENGKITNIEVEDVIGYIELMKDRVGTDSPEAAKSVIENLSKEIKPTELGSIYRTHALIRMLSEKMLNLRADKLESSKVKIVVENLTEQLFSHLHLISRSEAKGDIGFGEVIQFPSDAQTTKIDNLSEKLRDVMELDTNFAPQEDLGDRSSIKKDLTRAIITDGSIKYRYKTQINIQKNEQQPNNPIVNIQNVGWIDS